jgi:hypothetical protein
MSSLVGIFRANFIAGLLVIAGCLASASTIAQTQFMGDILLGRPTDKAISVSVMSFRDTQVYLEYGSASGDYSSSTQVQDMSADDVYVFEIDGLNGDAEYFYRVRFKSNTSQIEQDYANTPEYSFNTAKSPGATFSFAVEADPHLGARTRFEKWCGNGCDREAASDKIYARTVENMLVYDPDFLVDLGDFFMTSQNIGNALFPIQERTRGVPITEAEVLDDVLYVRSLFTQGGPSIPIMLVQGNHEAEDGNRLDGTPNNVAVWAVNARKKYFPSPTDNGFYSGPTEEYDFIGRQDGHYAWEWGDALFIALDPYWEPNRSSGSWGKSLGRDQFSWLQQTLENSDAAFKFVFIHHLVGGCDNSFGGSRGGALCSDYFEWGGRTPFDYEERWLGNTPFGGQVQDSPDPVPPVRRVDSSTESYDFDENRPGWGVPIQQMLLDNGVQIVFHGHDHLYVRETHPSGLIYHEIPQPSREAPDGQGLLLQAANENYDYEQGVVVAGGGFVNVTVSPDQVRVDYIRTLDDCNAASCGEIADSYTVLP